MGIPKHYSLQLPDRCRSLIEELWAAVEKAPSADRYGGSLTTTFLLSLATPMIVMPVERLLKQGWQEGFADDRPLDAAVTAIVQGAFGARVRFGDCPFFSRDDGWTYAFSPSGFNVAYGLPHQIAEELALHSAQQAASELGATDAIKALRNALAHAVIAYLDAQGHSTFGASAHMLAFVGEVREDRKFVGLHILRISESGFRAFLGRWVDWLNASGVADALAA